MTNGQSTGAKQLGVTVRWLAVTAALVYPTVFTWLYFIVVARPDRPAATAQTVFIVGKVVQFGFPVAWLWFVERRRFKFSPPTCRALAWGFGTGLAMALAIAAGFWVLRGNPLLAETAAKLRIKWVAMGMTSRALLIALGLFYILFHTLLEEYYWRWFVFGRLRELVSTRAAIGVSSVGFMAHHVILVATYFGLLWGVPISLAVACAGAIWAWLDQRSGLLYGPWLSHMLVEIALFAIGYHLVYR